MSSPRVAFVTGAAQGIGEAIALRLGHDQENISVFLFDLPGQEALLEGVVKKIESNGRKAAFFVGNVTSEESVKSAVDKCVEVLGGLDILVANAGVGVVKPFLENTLEEFHRIINVNLLGTYLCYKYGALQMIKQGRGGRIIGASSLAGKQGVPNGAIYSASKAAVRGLTQSVSVELRPHKITVNAYAPGIVLTPLNLHPDDDKHGGPGSLMKIRSGLAADAPHTEPDTIAELVAYLIKEKANYTTGQTISLNGGLYFD